MSEAENRLLVAAQLPPPVTGLSAVNRRVLSRLQRHSGVVVVDLSAPEATSGPVKHAHRLLHTLAAVRLILSTGSTGRRTLYMPSDGGLGILLNVALATAARTAGFDLIIHHHSYAYINRRSRLMQALIACAPKGTTHVVLCDGMGEQLHARYKPTWRRARARTFVLPNGFMIDRPAEAPAAGGASGLTLCHLSNLTAAKGALTFLRLFDALRAEGLDVSAQVAGPATEASVEAALHAAAERHGDRFSWVGPVYGDAKAAFLRSADVFVFPTEYENEAQPLVLLEALGAGLPILTIGRGCIGCDYDETVGLVADDADSFLVQAEAWLREVLAEPARLGRLKQQALETATARRDSARAGLDELIRKMTSPA